jgi:hypothetical protein
MRRLSIGVLVMFLLLGACGGSKKQNASTTNSSSSTTAAAGDTTTTGGASGGAGASATTVAGSKSATTKKGSASPSGGGGAGAQQSTPAGIKATAPGTYTYKLTGTATIGATPQNVDTAVNMKVDPLQGTDQHSASTGGQTGTETVLRFQPDGVYLVNLKLTGAVNKEFVLNPPGLAFPQPATIGKAWSWTAKSTDGQTTVASSFKILRTETIQIGSESVPTVVVQADVTTDGDVKSTDNRVMWVSEAYRLTVKQTDKTNGTYGAFAFSSDTTEVLQSTKPS